MKFPRLMTIRTWKTLPRIAMNSRSKMVEQSRPQAKDQKAEEDD